ncbi:MAG TPA: prepilin-type N-terminal cleavage/methylation domain-containing protein [Lysobacter sp.]
MQRMRGYTLVEVIVAFAVLALALTLLLGTLTNAGRQVRWSADAGRAALLAQSVLEQAEMDGPWKEGERRGALEDGRYRWTLSVRRFEELDRAGQPLNPGAPSLFTVDLTMQWGDGGPRERLELRSLRLVPAIAIGPIT